MSKRRGCLTRLLIFGLILTAMSFGVLLVVEAAGGWGLRPFEDGLGWFDLSLQPGDTYESALLLLNQSDESVTLVVAAVSEVNSQRGGFSLANHPGGLTEWLDFPEQTITLDHHSQKRIPFTLTIPASAAAADYGAGFVAYEPFDSNPEGEGIRIVVVNRSGVSILARVGEPNECGIRFEGARFNASPEGGVSIQLDLTNTGNVAFEGTGSVNLRSINQADSDWHSTLRVGFSLPGPILYPIHAPVDAGAYLLEAEVESLENPGCRDALSASFDLQPSLIEQEPTALGDLFEGLFSAAAEGMGNRGPDQTPYPIDSRLIIGIALVVFGLVFGGGWLVGLTWLLARRKGKKGHKRGLPPESNRERLNWRETK